MFSKNKGTERWMQINHKWGEKKTVLKKLLKLISRQCTKAQWWRTRQKPQRKAGERKRENKGTKTRSEETYSVPYTRSTLTTNCLYKKTGKNNYLKKSDSKRQ